MDIKVDYTDTVQEPTRDISAMPATRALRRLDAYLVFALVLVALLPRILIALRLDVVTDEIDYILAGVTYVPLLLHFNIGNSGWLYNYEHPPVVKLLIGTSIAVNTSLGHPLSELFAARIPSIISGTILVAAIYWLGQAPFGRVVAFLAALSLAVSPWLVYFSGLAYLDMTMTMFITITFLLLWYAIRRPWLYLIVALLLGLGAASKYTAVLIVPGLFLFSAYYFFVLRLYLPKEQRPRIPWLWWLAAIILAPLCFLGADPAIWPHPIPLLLHSFDFEWNHSIHGHLTFIAGAYVYHVPQWSILYILLAKISAFVTIPATFFVVFTFIQLAHFHLKRTGNVENVTNAAFLFIWLLSTLAMFSFLNIVVGTHYHLPLAPPVAIAGAFGMVIIVNYLLTLFRHERLTPTKRAVAQNPGAHKPLPAFSLWQGVAVVAMALMLAGPHLFGLITIPAAEGYTSEFFQGENQSLQVAYPGYRDALQWLDTHTNHAGTHPSVGLVSLFPHTLTGRAGYSWFRYNQDYAQIFTLTEVHPGNPFPYDYLIWPMHLVQRGYTIPPLWRAHIIHTVMGGNTIYCFILAQPSLTTLNKARPMTLVASRRARQ